MAVIVEGSVVRVKLRIGPGLLGYRTGVVRRVQMSKRGTRYYRVAVEGVPAVCGDWILFTENEVEVLGEG